MTASLADNELLLPDIRVEELWSRLMKEFGHLPDDTAFASYIQPERVVPRPGGVIARMPAQAIFLVVSKNPHPRHKGEMLKSVAQTTLEAWRASEAEAWRFVGRGDPAMPIFRALCREHLASRKSWSELN